MKKISKKLKTKLQLSGPGTPTSQSPTRTGSPAPTSSTPTTVQTKEGLSAAPVPTTPLQSSSRTESLNTVSDTAISVPRIFGTTSATPFPPAPQSRIPALSRSLSGPQDMMETGWNGFKLALSVLKDVSSIFPPLEGALSGLLNVINVADQVSTNYENFESMVQQINRLSHILQAYKTRPDRPVPEHVQVTIDALSQSVVRRRNFIEERMKRGLVGRFLNASDDANDVVNSLRELSFAVELFQIGSSISTEARSWETLEIVKGIQKHKLLEILDPVRGARYDESSHTGCMDGTRIDTLTQLLAWAADPTSRPIFWLTGMAGIGKSAIAHSFCQQISKKNRLGASFFCSRQSESLSNISRVLPTIAYQLAFGSRAYCEGLIQVLGQTSHTSYSLAALQKQAQDLLIGLKDSFQMDGPTVVVIDALDECARFSDVSDLLRVLLRSELPIKFLITSRPETHIGKGFSAEENFDIDIRLAKAGGFLLEMLKHASLRLHDVEHDVVEEDITRYLTSKLSSLLERLDRENARIILSALAKKSGNLFIFAFTAAQYISGANLSPMDARRRLSMILQTSVGPPSTLSTQAIDGLYQQIFESAYRNKEQFEIDDLRASLDTLLCLRKPESISVISALLESDQDDVRAHLENFSSVLSIPNGDNEPVFTFHASFLDYCLDSRRSKEYALNSHDQHQRLAVACLKLMNSTLHEDMCSIKRRQTLNADISESVIRSQITPALRYACVYWSSHLTMGAGTIDLGSSVFLTLMDFVDIHLLHWLECLSLVEELHAAFDCVQRARLFVVRYAPKAVKSKEVQEILLDTQYMIPQVYHFLKLHALEIYVSALMWLPELSALKARYPRKQPHRILSGLERHWDPCLQVLQSDFEIRCLATSPNGVDLAWGAGHNVQIWSLETGECLKQLVGHRHEVRSVAFSPDGSKLASGSYDTTLHIWNAATGELIRQLVGHTDWVNCVVFSSNGLKLASASDDRTVRIWNAYTGELIQQLKGHTDCVECVAFSPDGSKLASGSDITVWVWNAVTGDLIQQLEGHTYLVNSIAFSPDGSKIASGSDDKTVHIRNTETGELLRQLVGHTGFVETLAFSPDGSKLVSGSDDETLRIWNIDNGELIQQLRGHRNWVRSVVFSPDGSQVVSGSSDKTVQVWNVGTRQLSQQLATHTHWVSSIAFSADQSMLASGSFDRTVQIRNAYTGELIQQLIGHRAWVNCVAFSFDGLRLASGSDDETVQVWDTNTGTLIWQLKGHTGPVRSVVFSSDKSKLASGAVDKIVRIWNADAGQLIWQLTGHTDWLSSIVFSPNGSKLASSSYDATVQIWNLGTGKLVHQLAGHKDTVRFTSNRYKTFRYPLKFSQDGSKLASRSVDGAVQVWDVETGYIIGENEVELQKLPRAVFWSIDRPSRGQKCIALQDNKWRIQPQLWLWGSSLRDICTVSFTDDKACLGYRTGRIMVLELSIENHL